MARKSTRRRFLGDSAVAGAGFYVGTQAISARAQEPSALNALTAGCVGVGGKGGSDSSHISENGVKLVGLCDIDAGTLTKKAREFTDAQKFSDFREMLDRMGDKIDIVTVSTPDHNHAIAAIKAMRMKKHVYCQKPLTYSIREARWMQQIAAETGVITQMGNQGTSGDGFREAVEVLRDGAIGDVEEVHIWTNRPVWPQGQGRPEGEDPIPEGLDWESWIGTAPMRPYKEGVYHSFKWRGWLDFGTGALGDMACHTTNMPVMALELWDPIAVTCMKNSGLVDNETFPAESTLKFEFPERNGLKPCHFFWYDGGQRNNLPPDDVVDKMAELGNSRVKRLAQQVRDQKAGKKDSKGNDVRKTSGVLLIGSKGMMFSPGDYGQEYYLLPEEDFAGYTPPPATLPRIPFKGGGDQRQKWEFVSTIKGEYKAGTMSNFGYAGKLTETILVGNLSLRAKVGQRIEWDAKNLRSPNVEEINQFVDRTYREGWEIEPPASA